MSKDEGMAQIDRFVAETKRLIGHEIRERALWNTHVSEDAIRHFASGIGDDNPLFIDPDYGRNGPYGCQIAPPAFLASVLYPMSHGASMPVPLWFLAGDVTYEWFQPIIANDRLRATFKIIDVLDTESATDDRRILIVAETCYINQEDRLIGKSTGTTACVPSKTDGMLLKRSVYMYSEEEIEKLGAAISGETRRGKQYFDDNELTVGQALPPYVRGPLDIGDLVCWHSAIGPAYKAGAPGFRNRIESSHGTQTNPATGWPIESSQQHNDFLLASQRGMPLPFDQGVMRFACLSPMVTNWIGDKGFLNSLSVKIIAPNLYGDSTWYSGSVSERTDTGENIFLKLKITGKNQLDETTTEADATITLPKKDKLTFHHHGGYRESIPGETVTGKEKWAIDLFEQQALKHPEAVSLVFKETKLTYQELNHQVDRVAGNLFSQGIKANTPVAVCMDRSHNFIVAVLAILKSGASYVPMDPAYPRKRLEEILKDCRPQALILDGESHLNFQGYSGKIIVIESLLKNMDGSVVTYPHRKIRKEDIAYIMYTSGSGGKAKGVTVTQGNLSSYILALQGTFDIDDADIYLHSASFAFSASVRQIFLPLCSGATLVIADDEQRSDPIALAELICREKVTHWDTVPSIFSLCCDTFLELDPDKKNELTNNWLRRIMATGEPLTWDVCRAWHHALKQDSEIVNLYSQTETSGTVCTYEVPRNPENVSGIVPIGRPLPDTTLYILSEDGRPVSYGEAGEICVAGPRIAKGYLEQPELTALQFIPHPFNAGTGVHVFKTGDLGCYMPSGNIITKGRKDRRVKARGFRIELEEVERALRAHPEVRQAVTAVSDEKGSDGRLLAYCIPKRRPDPQKAELRSFLQATLPDYMLPSFYIFLEEMPLGPNGKVDYQALPVPDFPQLEPDNTFVAPQTSIETVVAGIWADVLKVDHVGTHDNFWELGGHSLLAARMLAKLRKEFKIDLSIQNILNAPTVAEFALYITSSQTEETSSDNTLSIIDELENMSEDEARKLLEEGMRISNLSEL